MEGLHWIAVASISWGAYFNEVLLPVAVTPPAGISNFPIKAKASWLICEKICVPGSSSLEQEFNSLDAQREACEAYITSQKHEGWTVLATLYDDGAYSGGTMDRPALQRLLDDVRAGKIDVVVVYKVDRLTRSLADFAKIVEIFDAQRVSFVSVTQAFNTTTSMGRLTLNVLLAGRGRVERSFTPMRTATRIAPTCRARPRFRASGCTWRCARCGWRSRS